MHADPERRRSKKAVGDIPPRRRREHCDEPLAGSLAARPAEQIAGDGRDPDRLVSRHVDHQLHAALVPRGLWRWRRWRRRGPTAGGRSRRQAAVRAVDERRCRHLLSPTGSARPISQRVYEGDVDRRASKAGDGVGEDTRTAAPRPSRWSRRDETSTPWSPSVLTRGQRTTEQRGAPRDGQGTGASRRSTNYDDELHPLRLRSPRSAGLDEGAISTPGMKACFTRQVKTDADRRRSANSPTPPTRTKRRRGQRNSARGWRKKCPDFGPRRVRRAPPSPKTCTEERQAQARLRRTCLYKEIKFFLEVDRASRTELTRGTTRGFAAVAALEGIVEGRRTKNSRRLSGRSADLRRPTGPAIRFCWSR